MTKADMIAALAETLNTSKAEAGRTLEAVIGLFTETLTTDGKVSIPGVGILSIRERAERTGRNPQNGEALVIPARKAVAFRAGKSLKEAVQG